jgi:starvation-inducible DNA-binding protein
MGLFKTLCANTILGGLIMNAKLYEKMNLYLANQEISYIKLHNLHWYVKGRSFFTLHAKLEELYDQTATIIDDVAERLLALGQSPVANMKQALSMATIKELEDAPISSEDTVRGLMSDVEYWIRDTKEIVGLAEQAGDGATADQFNGYLSEYQKLMWMLKAYLA